MQGAWEEELCRVKKWAIALKHDHSSAQGKVAPNLQLGARAGPRGAAGIGRRCALSAPHVGVELEPWLEEHASQRDVVRQGNLVRGPMS